ncbi:MAG: hypothetical protein LBF12_07520 [Christensenellaceae bacterium]|jgi:hypothetical protein|nr:hypothetical protein [Christensenellaceae bacterium]
MSRKSNVQDRIKYQRHAKNEKEYATFCPSDRRHGGSDIYLGCVVDKEKGIFHNHKQGIFKFTIKNGREDLLANDMMYYPFLNDKSNDLIKKHLIVGFGDCWFLDTMLKSSGLNSIIVKTIPEESDTFRSLISYSILEKDANVYAGRWYNGSFARYLYPDAKMHTSQLNDFLKRLGREEIKQKFFSLYFPYLKQQPNIAENVLISSTSLKNSIDFEYSKISNHNGVIERQTRLIYVVERNTGLPMYFRYVEGNIVDVNTLQAAINYLKEQKMDIKHTILDAGYCSEIVVKNLHENNIPFIFLMSNVLSKTIFATHGADLMSDQYCLKYGERLLYIREIEYDLFGVTCYLYIAIDFDKMNSKHKDYSLEKLQNNQKNINEEEDFGYFILVSSESIKREDVLPPLLYETNFRTNF